MPYEVPIEEARLLHPEFTFVSALTPSEQKAAFHVRDESTGQDLCLKLISPHHNTNRIDREFEGLREIEHPNVVRVVGYTHSLGNEGRRHFLLEEFIEGEDLSERFTGAVWDLREIVRFFRPLFSGLSALSEKRIVHRDLKPANIRVRPDGAPVIVDFGLIRRLDAPSLTDTASGAAIGTPAYFAPEQFTGTRHDIDPRTDLFATGVLMYQAATGSHPFLGEGMTLRDLQSAVCGSDEHFARGAFEAMPEPWQFLIRKLMAKERVSRFADASLVEAFLGNLEV